MSWLPNDAVTLKEAAALLGVTYPAVWGYVRRGELRSYQLFKGSSIWVSRADIVAFMEERGETYAPHGR